jgi:ATP-dependent DNA helicase RecG
MSLTLNDSVQYLKGVGPALAEKLTRLGILSVEDLLYHIPRSYEDRRHLRLLGEVKEGERATFRLKVIAHSSFYYNGRTHPKIEVRDQSGHALLYCFNRNFLKNQLTLGTSFYLTGGFSLRKGMPVFSQFDYTLEESEPELAILPVYPLTAGVSQKQLRRLVRFAVEHYAALIRDETPSFINEGYGLKSRGELLREIHFPQDMEALRRAKEGFSYKEFFKYQIVAALARKKNMSVLKQRKATSGGLKADFMARLHFTLTHAQEQVLSEIEEDLMQPRPMNRLIQGDVGSGKTVVALISLLDCIEAGGQAAFMAPTEILARQHFQTISGFLEGLPVRVEYISGAIRGEQRGSITKELQLGRIHVVVGTHALFSEDVVFRDLSFVVIDEQHKFGVLQRGRLRAKGTNPDCIVMSATPIPRTLSMTLYGDLDVSIIDEMPPGRAGVSTHLVKQAQIERVYDKVREVIAKGQQVYFIYPVIEESSADLKNAMESYERLKEVFSGFRVGLLHGRMSDEEKEAAMRGFKNREFLLLVSTTVVEVGVDVPNATVMVIEQAERFGLSSIHQLRGRIGRGSLKSYCFLVPDRSTGREAYERLRILQDTQDGFKIAEWDLRMRGPGEIIGKRQSGVPSFIIEDFDINTKLIYRAQRDARRFVEGEIGTQEERERFLSDFLQSDSYREFSLYFGG